MPTDRLFTGQRDVGLGGLYHYTARFYLPKLGRFVSADTIVPSWASPQSLNRYAYVLNNPLNYIDPTGHHQMCSGTDAFISESDGDGGSSWSSCWARQRDSNNDIQLGMSQALAGAAAAARDALGTVALSAIMANARSNLAERTFIGGWDIALSYVAWHSTIRSDFQKIIDNLETLSNTAELGADILLTFTGLGFGEKLIEKVGNVGLGIGVGRAVNGVVEMGSKKTGPVFLVGNRYAVGHYLNTGVWPLTQIWPKSLEPGTLKRFRGSG
jgi:RHS repeat-associated protein